ncbi:MAG: zinc ABC transporter substrate-binding protein [Bdellovibrionaceae bacterium]|nr:zinc ABC transporter substrate-binding protein [Pseudobdellovibrionaceae bacterium]
MKFVGSLLLLVLLAPVVRAAPIPVVTSFSILKNLVEEVGGDAVTVKSLIPAGADPHGFHPRPSDVLEIKKARLVFLSGWGLEPWAAQLWKSSKSTATLVEVSDGLKPLAAESGLDPAHLHGHDHDHDHHQHGPNDPHYWHDPARVRQVVAKIAAKLAEVEPTRTAEFNARAEKLNARILEIETATRTALAGLRLKDRVALSPHDGFKYMGDAFGVRFVSVMGVSTNEDLSAERLAGLQKMLKAGRIQVAFFERGHHERALRTALSQSQIPTETLDGDSLGEQTKTYVELLRSNTEKLVRAFAAAASSKVTP